MDFIKGIYSRRVLRHVYLLLISLALHACQAPQFRAGLRGSSALVVPPFVPPVVTQLVIKNLPAAVVARAPFGFQIELQDEQGQIVASTQAPIGALTVQSNNTTGSFATAVTIPVVNGVASFTGLQLRSASPTTLTVHYETLSTSGNLLVTPGSPFELLVTGPTAPVVSEVGFNVGLRVRDQDQNTVTNYTGPFLIKNGTLTVHSGSFSIANQGFLQTQFNLALANTYSLTASTGSLQAGFPVTVIAGPPNSISLGTTVPPTQLLTTSLYSIGVIAIDHAGNRVTGHRLNLTSNAPGFVTQSYDLQISDNGAHTFTGLQFPTPATGISIEVNWNNNTAVRAISAGHTVILGPPVLNFNGYLPFVNGRYEQFVGMPVNVDTFSTVYPPGIDLGKVRGSWNPGNGTAVQRGRFFSYTYNSPGNYDITATFEIASSLTQVTTITSTYPLRIKPLPNTMVTYYVSGSRPNDSGSGLTPMTAWKTLDHAIGQYHTTCTNPTTTCPVTILLDSAAGPYTYAQSLILKSNHGYFHLSNFNGANKAHIRSTQGLPLVTANSTLSGTTYVYDPTHYVKLSNLRLESTGTSSQQFQEGGSFIELPGGGNHQYFENISFEKATVGYVGTTNSSFTSTQNDLTFRGVACKEVAVFCISGGSRHFVVDQFNASGPMPGIFSENVVIVGASRSLIRGSQFLSDVPPTGILPQASLTVYGNSEVEGAEVSRFEVVDNTFRGIKGIHWLANPSTPSAIGQIKKITITNNKFQQTLAPQDGPELTRSIYFKADKVDEIVLQNNDLISMSNQYITDHRFIEFERNQTSVDVDNGEVHLRHLSYHSEAIASVGVKSDIIRYNPPMEVKFNSFSLPGTTQDGPSTSSLPMRSGVLDFSRATETSVSDESNLVFAQGIQTGSLLGLVYAMGSTTGPPPRYSDTQWDALTGEHGDRNINNQDPLYEDVAAYDLRPKNVAPMISPLLNHLTTGWIKIFDDLEYIDRPVGPASDVGAHERTVGTGGGTQPGISIPPIGTHGSGGI